VTEDWLWVTGTMLCDLFPWWMTWFEAWCEQFFPQLLELETLCATEPPEIPEYDWGKLAREGHWGSIPLSLIDWVWAHWQAQNWASYCECSPTSGSGACPPVGEFGIPVTTFALAARVRVADATLPVGWTTMSVTFKVTAASFGGTYDVCYTLEDASHVQLGSGPAGRCNSLALGASVTTDITTSYTAPQRAAARYLVLWARPTGLSPQTGTDSYTFTPRMSATFTGTCSGITVTPPPPTPPPIPDEPPIPPMPPPRADCTLGDICARIDAMTGLLAHINATTSIHQVYAVPLRYTLGTVHAGLSGGGQFAVRQLVGVRVDLTSAIPGHVLEGQPQYLWDLGWLTISTADGMVEEIRYTRDTQIWQPRGMRGATTFGYYFKTGVTATVTELLAEQI
jgi:hypothetical protein